MVFRRTFTSWNYREHIRGRALARLLLGGRALQAAAVERTAPTLTVTAEAG